ncbi:hypothetical protein [Streptomyces sp. HPF1205]|uniref:hypothetical protein n=1 Tax=Streptomyces sp. HPF1205 TaxID=2873262 RepID=UPI001CEC8299|nr:hypothetical protein [Streptomyces sp. HPF1205]
MRASTESQFHGIAAWVLDSDQGAVDQLHLFLEAAATWHEDRGDEATAGEYRALATGLEALADDMVRLTEQRLHTAHRSATAPPRAPHGGPPAPPGPPAPSKPPRR